MFNTRIRMTLTALAATGLLAASMGMLRAAEPHQHADHAAADAAPAPGAPYLLANDPVTGQALAEVEHPVVIRHEGRELRFASQANAEKFKADPRAYLPAVDAAMIRDQAPRYPLSTCLVSGESLDAMGKPADFIYNNRLIRFCCGHCKGDFLKDPAKFIARLDAAAIEKQKADYTAGTCPVSGEKLGTMGDPADRVVGDHLVRLCCGHCESKLRADEPKYIRKLDATSGEGG
jgi:YHS domain-containing protein